MEETPPAWSARDTRFILGAERLFGFYYATGKATTDADTANGVQASESDISSTQINLLLGEASDNEIGLNPEAIPQLSAHAVIAGGLTIGGSVGAAFDSGEEDPRGQPAQDAPSSRVYLIGPRVGYLFVASPIISLWARSRIKYIEDDGRSEVDAVRSSCWARSALLASDLLR